MTMNKKASGILGALALVGALFFLGGAGGPTISSIEAKALVQQGALLLDVRTTGEFAGGHVAGALNIPVQELEAKLPAEKDRAVVIYCASGRRSAAAREILLKAGYAKVFDLGAMSNWK
jgi:rhodanese-related sulfurtransferase